MPIQKTVEVTSFAGIMVRPQTYSFGNRFNELFKGATGDKYYCAPGLAWHQRLLQCDWPYNLDEDDNCYQPLK